MGLGFPAVREKNLVGRLVARGGAADRRPLPGGRSRSPCGDVSFCLSRRKSGGPRRATGVVPGVIAGERMERVIGERGASAGRSGAILSLGSAQLRIYLRMSGLRIGLI